MKEDDGMISDKIKFKIQTALKPYRNNSYFNIYFYDTIEKISFITCKREEVSNFIFIDRDLLQVQNYEYIIIYMILQNFDYDMAMSTKFEVLEEIFFDLTHKKFNQDDLVKYKTFICMNDLYSGVNISITKLNVCKCYSLNINDVNVLNCEDNSKDFVKFYYNNKCSIKGNLINKQQYTHYDIIILLTLMPYFSDIYDIIIKYSNNILNKIDKNLLYSRRVQLCIQDIILQLIYYDIERPYIEFFISKLTIDSVQNIIDILPTYSFIYINEYYKEILIKRFKDDFNILLKLSLRA